jgi:FlaA1/EpsC-like NDP-sugar epimerase
MPYLFRKYYPIRNIFFVFGEGVLIFLAINCVLLILGTISQEIVSLPLVITKALLVTLVFQVCLYYFDLYDFSTIGSFSENASRITMAFGFGCILLALPYYLFPETTIPFTNFLISYLLICLFIAIWRLIYTQVLAKKMFVKPVLLIGTGNMARTITAEIMSRMDSGYAIAAFVGKESPGFQYPPDAGYLNDFSTLAAVAHQKKIETIEGGSLSITSTRTGSYTRRDSGRAAC